MKKLYESPKLDLLEFLACTEMCDASVGDPTYGTGGDFGYGDLVPDEGGDDI